MPADNRPATYLEAVEVGLSVMNPAQRLEFEKVGFYADPHTKYTTDFDRRVGEALGLSDGSNLALVKSMSLTHPEGMSWLEEADGMYSFQGAFVYVMQGIAARLQNVA